MIFRSLRYSLLVPYLVMVLLLTAVLLVSTYWATTKNISTFSDQYIHEVVSRISQAVRFHVHGSSAVLEAAFPEGVHVSEDIDHDLPDLRSRFWVATSMHSNPNDYVYYGNKNGQSVALKRVGHNEAELRIKTLENERRRYYHYQGIQGLPILSGIETHVLDPRSRIWYQLAEHTPRHIWTTVYIDFSSDDLVVTRAKRVLDGAQKVEGVVATDVSLKEIDNFISSLNLSNKARAFIVELDGKLLASNSQDTVIKDRDGNTQRISALNSGDDVIANAYSKVVQLIDQDYLHKRGRSHYVTTAKDNNGKLISVAAEHISDDAGLNWIALVAIPHEETFGAIHKQLWFGIAVGLLAFVLVAIIGIRIFDRISRHVTELSNNITRMRKGDLEVSVPTSRKDEIGDLARNFNSMHQEIFTDKLTQLANRTALNSLLNKYTRSNPADSDENDKDYDDSEQSEPFIEPFLLLFIDLNKFKPLNDNYGHDNGDRALIETASRLKAALRETDFVARLGGDEFVLVLPGSYSDEDIQLLLTKIQSTVEAPLTTLVGVEEEVCVGAAIGIARYPEDAKNAHSLLKIADKAMYQNKERSR